MTTPADEIRLHAVWPRPYIRGWFYSRTGTPTQFTTQFLHDNIHFGTVHSRAVT